MCRNSIQDGERRASPIFRYENEMPRIKSSAFSLCPYTHFVLSRILSDVCRLTVTDGQRILLCHSCDPYPVWIWLAHDATDAEKSEAFRLARREFGLGNGRRFNLDTSLAAYFLNRAEKEGLPLRAVTNLLAYSCQSPVRPSYREDGEIRAATKDEEEDAAGLLEAFKEELGFDQTDKAGYRRTAQTLISDGRLFFYIDTHGERVAMASYGLHGEMGSINNVYTLPSARRRGYAARLVYRLTQKILALEKKPLLYTDALYEASNACYEKIGYKREGSLVTLL